MKFLYCGDVVGRSGRDAIVARIPELRRTLDLDFVLVNGENAAAGFGITGKICEEFYAAGVDAIVLGNHSWDQRETIAYINGDPKLLRPLNYPKGTPGRGSAVFTTQKGQKVLVVQVMGRIFMDPLDDPFAAVEAELQKYRLGAGVDAIIVDIHGEASSEKQAMGNFCDGRASFVVGTHTHVPTADTRILPGGTGFQTDAGMCGCYDSVIGMDKQNATQRFTRKMPGERLAPADGPVTLCGVFMDIDPKTGLCRTAHPVRLGGLLAQSPVP